ncbi:MAG: hypothetical protein AABX03_01870 [Nanoarchaeota archaeon]|mgnify:CR=1 FL=1
MNIAFDCDGVISYFHSIFSKVANELFGIPIVEDINEVKSYLWDEWHPLSKKQVNNTWRKIDEDVYEFWYSMEPLVDSSVFKRIKTLEENNHKLFFVTSRRDTAGRNVIAQTNDWIRNHIGLTNFSIIPSEKKGKIIEGINADYFIEDCVENLLEVFHQGTKCKLFLLARPYNNFAIEFLKKSHKYRTINIVYSVDAFLDIIENAT